MASKEDKIKELRDELEEIRSYQEATHGASAWVMYDEQIEELLKQITELEATTSNTVRPVADWEKDTYKRWEDLHKSTNTPS